MKSWYRKFVSAAALVLMTALPALAQAPDGTTVYTRVALWQIARPTWDAYAADIQKNTVPVLDKMLADGLITEYGVASSVVHTPDGFTHVTWFSSKTIAGLEKALAGLEAISAKLSPADRRREDTEFAGSKHADSLVSSRIVRGRTAKLTSGYLYLANDVVQPGKVQAYNDRYEKLQRPVMETLFADGTVNSFGVDNEYIHTANPGARVRWYLVGSAEGIDKVNAAGQAANQARTPAERDAAAQAAREILDGAAHRDELWRIAAYASKY